MIEWSDEAVAAALSQLKASRFSNMTQQEAVRQVLYAASNAQERYQQNKAGKIGSDQCQEPQQK